MGIRGLETYIRENPHVNIAQNIDIRDEIKEWQKENDGKSPTIIINLNHFVKILAKIDRNGLIYGGQYDTYNRKITKFFDELQKLNAKLVFFCRPFFNDINEEIIEKAYDIAVRGQKNLGEFKETQMKHGNMFPWHQDKRFLYNLIQICSKYGEIHTYISGTTFHIVQYAREHHDEVLAMIQYDTAFLLFDGDYQYWSLADLDIVEFTTKNYCREILYERLQLNGEKQYQMLAALSRLDFVSVCKFVSQMRMHHQKTDVKNDPPFFKLAVYVRNLENLDSLERIATDIFGENYKSEQLKQIQDKLAEYEMPKPDNLNGYDQSFRSLVDFFLTNNLYFSYGLAVETFSTNQALVYIDLRQEDSSKFIDLMTTILMKQCGIMFKDLEDRPAARAIKMYRSIDARNNNDEIVQDIIYPPPILPMCPTLNQLIIEEKRNLFDDSRWSLFGWSLDLDSKFIVKVRSQFQSKFMQIVSFTLKFLVSNNAILHREADLIFLTELKRPNVKCTNSDESSAATRTRNVELLNGTSVTITKSNGERKNDLPTNDNTTSSTPAAAPNPLVRHITDALFRQSDGQCSNSPTSAPIGYYRNITSSYNTENWRDPHSLNVPSSTSAAPWRHMAMNGFRRNDGFHYNSPPHYRNYHRSKPDPHHIDGSWIQTAHKYTIAFESVCHCLELCGLRKETDLIQFDAFDFHAKMRQNKKEAIDDELRNTKTIRLYY